MNKIKYQLKYLYTNLKKITSNKTQIKLKYEIKRISILREIKKLKPGDKPIINCIFFICPLINTKMFTLHFLSLTGQAFDDNSHDFETV